MSSRHLPAGQNIPPAQGGPGGIGVGGGVGANGMPHGTVDMTMSGHGQGPNLGPRRRQQPAHPPPPHHHQYQPQYHQHMTPPMYSNYMPYTPQPYYSGIPPQYPNGGMPSPGYMHYQNQGYPRSPQPAMHPYAPMVGVTVPPSYSRPLPQSPAPSTPYQPPPVSVPIPPHTPSSTHSSQIPPPPTPPTPQTVESVVSPPPSQEAPKSPPPPTVPFRAPLPWLSRPDLPFPIRSSKLKTSRKVLASGSVNVSLPIERHEPSAGQETKEEAKQEATPAPEKPQDGASEPKTPVTEKVASTSGSDASQFVQRSPASAKGAAINGRPVAQPALPLVSLPKSAPKPPVPQSPRQEVKGQGSVQAGDEHVEGAAAAVTDETAEKEVPASAPAPKPAPSSWANLFAKPAASPVKPSAAATGTDGASVVNGHDNEASSDGPSTTFPKSNASNVADAIRSYKVNATENIGYIEPRGLINTGNMCYMNSILQVLMFCVPFYDFLNQVSRRAAHSFKSDTPLIDAMIMFMHEFPVIKSASSVGQLRRSLKPEEVERYGEPFIPEYVYAAIKQLPRFASMRRGHQQDAEEFLGFLLQSLDDECTHVLGTSLSSVALNSNNDSPVSDKAVDDWLEVGRKQKAAVTRLSGTNITTPITKIFGGLLRSEFRVPGLKDSITTEPYQPLQLDIGSPEVRNVVDALRGLTRPERLQGDFNSPRGKDVIATKQVFIETLPPVLILHLKRFQFDAEGHGTIKIWKKIDYPLELEIPREALSRQYRQSDAMPKYKLISVVYHHGKNASGGHYTNDVRRPDGQDWLRFDDTVLRQVRSDDVAEKHLPEDEKNHRKDTEPVGASGNRYGAMDEENGDDDGWKQVTTSANGNKRWSSVVNGAGNASKGKQAKDNIKENKVAYLLFYQRV
ncbi:hypothetical protein V2G26_009168 [Clonostachys chloroleuca]